MRLSKYEQETIINYNQADKTASIYTCDKVLIGKLDKMMKIDSRIQLETKDEVSKTYIVPKTGIKVRLPRILTVEQSLKRREIAIKSFGIDKSNKLEKTK